MAWPIDPPAPSPDSQPDPADRDERLGEAIESYLALAESGSEPDPEQFAASHPGLEEDLLAALEGLALVRGLVGESAGSGAGSGAGRGLGRLESGRRVAGYRVVRELGRGGMGVVYEAVHVGLDRPVALKVLGARAAPDPTGRRRFLNEARTAARLHHTHIVPVFDVGQVGGLCYYAMQRIEGSGLDRVLRRLRRDRSTAAGPTSGGATPLRSLLGLRPAPRAADGSVSATGSWPPRGVVREWDASESLGLSASCRETSRLDGHPASDPGLDDDPPPFEPPRGSAYYRWAAEVGRQAAEALGHAHRLGVIHRDVKPSNLLVDGRGRVWVADFGLAYRPADAGAGRSDRPLGTPRYMSPEQARGEPVDGRSDLFSLGSTLYELLTLRPPFPGRSSAELFEQIGVVDPPPPRQADTKLPRDLESIVLKLLSRDPAGRYATAEQVAEDLERFLNHEPVHARPISPPGRFLRFARRHPALTAVSTAAAVAIVAVTTVAFVWVLHERDKANAALRELLWHESSLVRLSNDPGRRATGLKLIRQAAALEPEPELKVKLRDEAVQFLVLRDVEAHPALPTGRSRGLAFSSDGARLTVLTTAEGGESLGVWDMAWRSKVAEHPIRFETHGGDPPTNRGPGTGPGPGAGRGARGGSGRGPSGPSMVMVAAGGSVAVLAPGGHGVQWLDARTGAKVGGLPPIPGHRVGSLLAAADGRRLVTVESVVSPTPSTAIGPPSPRPGPGRPGEGFGRVERFLVKLWDTDRPARPVATLTEWKADQTGPPDLPLVAVSPDGKTLATARLRTSAVSFWSAETGISLGEPMETQTELTALALGPDSQLATAGGGEVRLWDVDSRTALPSLTPGPSEVWLLRFSPLGSLLAVVGRLGREVELWDTASRAVVAVLPAGEPVGEVVFAPDGRTLAAAGRGMTTPFWTVAEPDARARLDAPTRSMAFRRDGLLALGSRNGTVRFWSDGHCVPAGRGLAPQADEAAQDREDAGGRDRLLSVAFDDRGRLITLDAEALRVWDDPPRSSSAVAEVPLSEGRLGPSTWSWSVLAPSRDGRTMAVVRGGRVLLWRSDAPGELVAVTPPLLHPLPALTGPPAPGRGPDRARLGRALFPLALAPTGNGLYAVEREPVRNGRGLLRAWALDGPRARLLDKPALPIDTNLLVPSPDGRVIAAGDRTGVVTLVDTALWAVRARLTPLSDGPASPVVSLAFAPDARELAVGDQQGNVSLWSLVGPAAPAPLVHLPGHRGSVAALAYDAAGHFLASAGSDRTVDVWDLARVRNELTRLELGW